MLENWNKKKERIECKKSCNYFAKFEIKSDNEKNEKVSRQRRQINWAIENPLKVAFDLMSTPREYSWRFIDWRLHNEIIIHNNWERFEYAEHEVSFDLERCLSWSAAVVCMKRAMNECVVCARI